LKAKLVPVATTNLEITSMPTLRRSECVMVFSFFGFAWGRISACLATWESPMSSTPKQTASSTILTVLLYAAAALYMLPTTLAATNAGASPNFAPDGNTAWVPDRPAGDDFLPPESGPGPVMSEKAHPYGPNGQGQSTFRVADLSNPILKPWAVEQMRKANDEVLAGKIPFTARERCWPGGVPDIDIYERDRPVYIVQTAKEVVIITEHDQQVRHIYLNVPHSAQLTPSWYGESVGHYEGDTLVVDTIGMNDKTFVDNYRTPHTTQLHVVERFKMIDDGKTLQAVVTVDDPGTFKMPWSAVQRWRRREGLPIIELICAESGTGYFNYDVVPIPQADRPDF
jgi:hypothetical protein